MKEAQTSIPEMPKPVPLSVSTLQGAWGLLQRALALVGIATPLACDVLKTVEPPVPSAVESELPAEVVTALEAAARGEPFIDDIHPQTSKTGRPLSPAQQGFDVRHYALDLRVWPEERRIEGSVAVRFRAVRKTRILEFDLDPDLTIDRAVLESEQLTIDRIEDRFRISLPTLLSPGEERTVQIYYGGKPHVALAPPWHGGFVWSEVNGVPWFATAVQTEGCDLWWPCKDSYEDKPEEGVSVSVAAPRGIKVASIGILSDVEEGSDGFDTWRWATRHPITGYAVAINGGPFEQIELEYDGVNGQRYPVQFWALSGHAEQAEALLHSDALPDLAFFERMLGPYPWGDEKVGFVETPHLGMEHQTINGYGEQYQRGKHGFDQLLHHELAHEWFGNLMTHRRPQDAWLHEGYASYMQAVYAEERVGMMGYYDRMFDAYKGNEHCDPVVNPAVGDVGEAFDNRDIYTKGAWLLHTLRRYIGGDAFWAGTRRLIYDTAEPWSLTYPIQARYRTTEDFIRIMSEESGADIAWLVQVYLFEAGMPRLLVTRDAATYRLEWSVPGDRSFPMPVTVEVEGERFVVAMTAGEASVVVPEGARVLVDPDNDLLRDLPIIGDCSEQTSEQINHNIERFTRMARDYGWRRD